MAPRGAPREIRRHVARRRAPVAVGARRGARRLARPRRTFNLRDDGGLRDARAAAGPEPEGWRRAPLRGEGAAVLWPRGLARRARPEAVRAVPLVSVRGGLAATRQRQQASEGSGRARAALARPIRAGRPSVARPRRALGPQPRSRWRVLHLPRRDRAKQHDAALMPALLDARASKVPRAVVRLVDQKDRQGIAPVQCRELPVRSSPPARHLRTLPVRPSAPPEPPPLAQVLPIVARLGRARAPIAPPLATVPPVPGPTHPQRAAR